MGVVELDQEALADAARAWAERTCEAQGLDVKVTDPAVIGHEQLSNVVDEVSRGGALLSSLVAPFS